MKSARQVSASVLLLSLSVFLRVNPADGDDAKLQDQFFESKVRPILVEHCFECHSGDEDSGGLLVDSLEGLLFGGDSGPAIVPGHSDQSLLVDAIHYRGYEMPPDGPLPKEAVEILTRWIQLGARWPGFDPSRPIRKREVFDETDRNWWAIQPIVDPSVPLCDEPIANPIDAFLQRKITSAGLVSGPRSVPVDLVRRLFLDVVGLPPTFTDVRAFEETPTREAFERLVDQLLADPRYGEHVARSWLDLVRYAESDGYRADEFRPDAFRYRDYVVESFNDDKPYDRFIKEQLAADELYPDDPKALVGLGFLRHWVYEWNIRDARTQWTTILEDITDTTADVFLGLGLQCAKCHHHKFDPLLQDDYFRLRAFFEPIIPTSTPLVERDDASTEKHRRWESATAEVRNEIASLISPYRKKYRDIAIDRFPEDLRAIARRSPAERTPREEQLAYLIYRQVVAEFDRLDKNVKGEDKERLITLQRKLASYENLRPPPIPMAMTVTDVSSLSSPTRLPKGKQKSVEPGPPTILDAAPSTVQAANASLQKHHVVNTLVEECVSKEDSLLSELRFDSTNRTTGRRSTLAQWMTSPTNPLVARVIVNRIWQHYFGRGLAENPSDFGVLGGPPSHPELLDWLASRLIENDWSLKSIHRLILTSDAYARSTHHPRFARSQTIDPENRLYWRRTTQRLSAEQIRDALLHVTEQLQQRIGGPSDESDAMRRSIYLKTKRNSSEPLLQAFDLPQRFSSSSRRNTTTTPLQSLLMFNGDEAIAFAKSLSRLTNPIATDLEHSIESIWERVYGRPIRRSELASSLAFVDSQIRLLRDQDSSSRGKDLTTGKLPFRDGRALSLRRLDLTPDVPLLSISHHPLLDTQDFTVEAFFQVRTVAESGAVRTVLAKAAPNQSRDGWKFGVTGKGSRRKPQTLVIQMFGKRADGTVGEAALFSDQHVALDTPYYAAVSFRSAGVDRPGEATFFLKDLSNDDEPISIARVSHPIVGGFNSGTPLTLGGVAGSADTRFDGLLDDIRITGEALTFEDLLFEGATVSDAVIAFWQFENDPGLL
ncbi:MAG: DUF1553 domain-containing protein, partial [Planctomycetota bacterium]